MPLPAPLLRLRTWARAEAPEGRLPGLDALRGFLALAVMAYHLSVWTGLFEIGGRWNMAMAKLGNFGVSAFFMLSGFLLFRLTPWEAVAREGLGRFWVRRWLRLAPLFLVLAATNVVLGLGMGPEPKPQFLLENLTLTFGAIHPNHALVRGGWYVGLVVLLYAAYPALAWLRARLGWPVLAVLFAGLLVWSFGPTLQEILAFPPGSDARFHEYVMPRNQLFLFLAGALLAELHARMPGRLRGAAVAGIAGGAAAFLAFQGPWFADHLETMAGAIRYRHLAVVAFVVFVCAFQGGRPGPLGRLWARIGAWSYGTYLLHPFVHLALQGLSPLRGWPLFWTTSLASLLLAAVSERLFEGPIARLVGPRKAAGAPS